MSSLLPIYLGTNTTRGSEGIYRTTLDLETGTIAPPSLVAKIENPSFLALSADSTMLCSVSETPTFEGKPSGSVVVFRVGQDGSLEKLSTSATGGHSSCHVDLAGNLVAVANYSSANFSLHSLQTAAPFITPLQTIAHEGKGPNPKRQERSHPHQALFHTLGSTTFLFVPDLGTDRMEVYRLDAKTLQPLPGAALVLPAGAGPRHLVFAKDNRHAYVANELDSTLSTFAIPENFPETKPTLVGTLSSLPADFSTPNTVAEIALHPNGKFLYVSNRGHDSIARFQLDQSGIPKALGQTPCGGQGPRSFAISPDGNFLVVANQTSDTLTTFRIDSTSGDLQAVGKPVALPASTCVLFAPLKDAK